MSGMVPLSALARASLGYKSLQNNFFYLNRATIDTYGIEAEFLRPVLRFRELRPNAYWQQAEPANWLFECRKPEGDLRGTGALRYIRSMATLSAKRRKQSGRVLTIEQALGAQGGGLWYAPKATPHPARVWLRKAINGVYAPFLFAQPTAVDQRCNFLEPRDGLDVHLLAAVVTSSVFAFATEINGSASMGAGALEAATTRLRDYPVFDPRTLSRTEQTELIRLARAVWTDEAPVDWLSASRPGPVLTALDRWLLRMAGGQIDVDRLYRDLAATCAARLRVARDKARTSQKRRNENIASVARALADRVRQRVEGHQYPDTFMPPDTTTELVTLPPGSVRHIARTPFLTSTTLVVTGDRDRMLFRATLDTTVAEVIVRALLMGRSQFRVPAIPAEAASVLARFLAWFDGIQADLLGAINETAFGTGYEDRLTVEVYRQLGLDVRAGARSLPDSITLSASSAQPPSAAA